MARVVGINRLNKIFTCDVCNKALIDPVVLPCCGESICLEHTKDRDIYICPFDNEVLKVPSNGFYLNKNLTKPFENEIHDCRKTARLYLVEVEFIFNKILGNISVESTLPFVIFKEKYNMEFDSFNELCKTAIEKWSFLPKYILGIINDINLVVDISEKEKQLMFITKIGVLLKELQKGMRALSFLPEYWVSIQKKIIILKNFLKHAFFAGTFKILFQNL